ncbi:MAG: hypothetical protein ACYC6Q_05360 [Syntrophales bacterium]
MSEKVQRFLVRVCPAPDHPEYYPWQTAQLCLFVGDDDHGRSFKTACKEIEHRQWLPIGPFTKETLIEDRVLSDKNEDIKSAYLEAKAGKIFFGEWLEQMPMAKKGHLPLMKAPRIDENFMDQVIINAGGRRLNSTETKKESIRNADYVLNDVVVELKDIQKEGLLVATRQKKLAQLFRGLAEGDDYAALAPSSLSKMQWREYLDILGGPIQNQVKSAAKQIKASRPILNCNRGAVIFLNTGYSTIPHELFSAIVDRYCIKDTQQIDFSISISSWLLTNGFESEVLFAFDPHEGGCDLIEAIRISFWNQINNMMTQWAQDGFQDEREMLHPIEPIAFRSDGMYFSTQPRQLLSELDKKWKTEQS